MKDIKTENFLTAGQYKWRYYPKIDFSEIDIKTSKDNPARLLRRVDEDRAISYGLAMEDGTEFPAIVLLTIDGAPPPLKYIIATGVHRYEAATLAHLTSFDAYVVVEADNYRRESLIRQLNTIEGHGVSIDDRVAQILQLHETYPEHSLKQLASEWNLPENRVKNAHAAQQAIQRGLRFGHDFVNGKVKLTQTALLALGGIHSDVVFAKAAHFATVSGASTGDIVTTCRDIKNTRDETSGLAVVTNANDAIVKRNMQSRAKHGRPATQPATAFFGNCRKLTNQADHGIDRLYLSAYSDKLVARVLCEETIKVLKRVIDELDRIERTEKSAARPIAAASVELH